MAAQIAGLTAERDAGRELHRDWVEGKDGLKWYIAQVKALTAENAALREALTKARDIAREAPAPAPSSRLAAQPAAITSGCWERPR
jgi:hypothetical protein